MYRISLVLGIAAACGCTENVETPRVPADEVARASLPTRWGVVEMPASLGGNVSRGDSIDRRGTVAGFANLPGEQVRHAAIWRHGLFTELGTLGGPNSSVVWPGQNDRGVVVGIAETADDDPLDEAWSCSAFFATVTGKICRGFVWEDGVMTGLPTFGGTHGFATGVNDRGQVVGWAETTVRDRTCNAPQVLQFRAALWEPRHGRMQQLPPVGDDSSSAATAINRRGQAVGISGDCDVAVGRFSARRAVLWENGRPIDIGNLGGKSWNTSMDINDRGDIVGFANPPGEADDRGDFVARAFLWTREHGIQNLGLLRPDDAFSQAFAINDRRQVVGLSCGADGCRAFVWQDGVMQDLNALVGPGYPDRLLAAQDINDAGEITGRALQAGTGKQVPFLATPIDDR
jgi:probable HAF family extracellular repeat protein